MLQHGPPSPAASSSSMASAQTPAPDHVVILYASETGNTQDAAERLGREFRRYGRKAIVLSMDTFDIFDLPHIPLLILLTSTHGRGDPPPSMQPLWTALLRTSLPEDILEEVNFALFGLGDSSYEKFNYAGKMLGRRMESLGAAWLGEAGWGDERAPNGTEEAFLPWLEKTLEVMLPYLPVEVGFIPLSNTSMPSPIYTLEPTHNQSTDSSLTLDGLAVSLLKPNGQIPAPLRAIDEVNGHDDPGGWKPDDWIWARLVENKRVTRHDWWQDVREIELEIDDPDFEGYPAGAICNLQPQSSVEEVDTFLDMMGLTEQADREYTIGSAIPQQPMASHLPPSGHSTTLRQLLTNHLNLRSPPRKSFFEWLRRFSPDERERERLDEFLADPDEIHTYATRPSRTINETLADFRETKLPITHLAEILPPLRRRQFSIASSWGAHPGKIQLLIAMVEYKTNLSIPRRGLCSSWLTTLPLQNRLPIKISPPTLFLPPTPSTPVILIGPGTGIAPMRSFLETRLSQGPNAIASTILYFGCRSSTADLFYADEWERYTKLGMKIRIAFSRDGVGGEKRYVQHLIREDRELIMDWVMRRSGWVYISGSSNAMPREVREAIGWCLSEELGEEGAGKYVEDLFEQGRGGEESW